MILCSAQTNSIIYYVHIYKYIRIHVTHLQRLVYVFQRVLKNPVIKTWRITLRTSHDSLICFNELFKNLAEDVMEWALDL